MAKSEKKQSIVSKIRKWKYTNFVVVVALSTALAVTILAVNQNGLTTTSQHAAGLRPCGFNGCNYGYPYPYPKPYSNYSNYSNYPAPNYARLSPSPAPNDCRGNGGTCINSTICRLNCNPNRCARYNCASNQLCCF